MVCRSINYYSIFQAFPDSLFHQLLLAMAHPDLETRVGSHRVLSAILVPSMVCPWSLPHVPRPPEGYGTRETHLVALSSFSSSVAMLEKFQKESCEIDKGQVSNATASGMEEEDYQPDDKKLHKGYTSRNDSHRISSSASSLFEGTGSTESGKEVRSADFWMHRMFSFSPAI